MTFPTTLAPALRSLDRPDLITLVKTALSIGELRFARQACLSWLAAYPGDLPVNLLHAQALLQSERPALALPILEQLCQTDPEYLEAVSELLAIQQRLSESSEPRQGKNGYHPHSGKHPASPPEFTLGWLLALGGEPAHPADGSSRAHLARQKSSAPWSQVLAASRHNLHNNQVLEAEQILHEMLPGAPPIPLVASTHLRILHARVQAGQSPPQALRSLAEHYHQRWPDCLQAHLLLADALILGGQEASGVELLHTAAARDVTAQVATRLWGRDHPYQDLWPARLDLALELPVPAAVGAVLGWNRLPPGSNLGSPGRAHTTTAPWRQGNRDRRPSGSVPGGKTDVSNLPWVESPAPETATSPEPDAQVELPETLRSVQVELERVGASIRHPELAHKDGRYPVYVILTTRRGLEQSFGARAGEVEGGLHDLAAAANSRRDWNALLYIADQGRAWRGGEPAAPALTDLPAAKANDPWEIKLAINDLDRTLEASGERIGALLIAGGPAIVPYHNLPNPVDDSDLEVPSDNPYGTLDENYFIPEWPVGRLPENTQAGQSADAYLLELAELADTHLLAGRDAPQTPWWLQLLELILTWLRRKPVSPINPRLSTGIAAAVWRQAAAQVFRPIGDPRALQTSPPLARGQEGAASEVVFSADTELGYFNLHGLDGAPEWFGQRDFSLTEAASDPAAGSPDYPVALHPEDILRAGTAPQIVFSEACYGAQIHDRSPVDALALAFLSRGTQAYIGSTCTSYGAIRPPLIAADLLAQGFWNSLSGGLPAGEALRRAKINLARDMHIRQGFLDGEDQKTLLSFILLGDPLAYPENWSQNPRPVQRALHHPVQLTTVCERTHPETAESVPDEVMAYVKNIVAHYLPGMQSCHVSMSRPHSPGQGAYCPLPGGKNGAPKGTPPGESLRVVTLSKQIGGDYPHRHYARLTLDAHGKLIKLAVSR